MKRDAAKRRGARGKLAWLLVLVLLLAGTVYARFRQAERPEPVIPEPFRTETILPESGEALAPTPAPAEGIESSPAPEPEPVTEPPVPTVEPAEPEAQPQSAAQSSEWPEPGDGYHKASYDLVSDIVQIYRTRGLRGQSEINANLTELGQLDPSLGMLWTRIMNYWYYVNNDLTVQLDTVPEGLPEDDSLCFVVLGFQLEKNGAMAPEMQRRCELALQCAQRYPEAYLAVTGGGTASGNKSATEARVMEKWFLDRGIEGERIIVEDRSITTAENARFTAEILTSSYPWIENLVIVSSSYHVPLGCLMFQEAALLHASRTQSMPFNVVSNAGWEAKSLEDFESPKIQASYVWILADPHYGDKS